MVLKWQYNGASFFFIRFVNLETKGNKIFFFAKNKNAFALLLLCLSFWYNYLLPVVVVEHTCVYI